jgi:hypothetical protein
MLVSGSIIAVGASLSSDLTDDEEAMQSPHYAESRELQGLLTEARWLIAPPQQE